MHQFPVYPIGIPPPCALPGIGRGMDGRSWQHVNPLSIGIIWDHTKERRTDGRTALRAAPSRQCSGSRSLLKGNKLLRRAVVPPVRPSGFRHLDGSFVKLYIGNCNDIMILDRDRPSEAAPCITCKSGGTLLTLYHKNSDFTIKTGQTFLW